MGKVNEFIFRFKMMTYQKNIMPFGIKSVPISEKNLLVNLPTIKTILKPK